MKVYIFKTGRGKYLLFNSIYSNERLKVGTEKEAKAYCETYNTGLTNDKDRITYEEYEYKVIG